MANDDEFPLPGTPMRKAIEQFNALMKELFPEPIGGMGKHGSKVTAQQVDYVVSHNPMVANDPNAAAYIENLRRIEAQRQIDAQRPRVASANPTVKVPTGIPTKGNGPGRQGP